MPIQADFSVDCATANQQRSCRRKDMVFRLQLFASARRNGVRESQYFNGLASFDVEQMKCSSDGQFLADLRQGGSQVARREPATQADRGRLRLLKSKCNHDRRLMAGCVRSRTAASGQRNTRKPRAPERQLQGSPDDRLGSGRLIGERQLPGSQPPPAALRR